MSTLEILNFHMQFLFKIIKINATSERKYSHQTINNTLQLVSPQSYLDSASKQNQGMLVYKPRNTSHFRQRLIGYWYNLTLQKFISIRVAWLHINKTFLSHFHVPIRKNSNNSYLCGQCKLFLFYIYDKKKLNNTSQRMHIPPDNWPLMKTCRAWPADRTLRKGYFPLFRKPSLGSILTLQLAKEKERKVRIQLVDKGYKMIVTLKTEKLTEKQKKI